MNYHLNENALIEPLCEHITTESHIAYLRLLCKVQTDYLNGESISRKKQNKNAEVRDRKMQMQILERINKSIKHYEHLRDSQI